MQLHTLDEQQHATVIAALRHYQRTHQGVPNLREPLLENVATNMGTVEALDDDGIDLLIEQLQTGKPPEMSVVQKLYWDNLSQDRSCTEAEDKAFIAKIDALGIYRSLPSLDDIKLPGDDGEPCRECEGPTDDGEGYDGLCGTCADRRTCSHCGDPIEDGGSDGECSDCAEKAVEAASRRGMAMFPREGSCPACESPLTGVICQTCADRQEQEEASDA